MISAVRSLTQWSLGSRSFHTRADEPQDKVTLSEGRRQTIGKWGVIGGMGTFATSAIAMFGGATLLTPLGGALIIGGGIGMGIGLAVAISSSIWADHGQVDRNDFSSSIANPANPASPLCPINPSNPASPLFPH